MVTARFAAALECSALPAALISTGAAEAARGLARDLARPARAECRESRLGAAASDRLDVLVAVTRGRGQALCDWLQQAGPELDPLRRASELLIAPRPCEAAFVSALWLEYDNVHRASPRTLPSLSACLVPDYVADRPAVAAAPPRARELGALLEQLSGERLDAASDEQLQRCLRSLPSAGQLIHASVMVSRAAAPRKLYCMLPRDALLGFLRDAGWRGPQGVIGALVEQYCPASRVGEQLYVDVTLTGFAADGGNSLGLVFAPQHLALAKADERDPARASLLQTCERAGLCSGAERRALCSWPGRWLFERELGPGRTLPWLCERWLDLKLVWTPGAPLLLKSYLGHSDRAATTFDQASFASAGAELPQVALHPFQKQLSSA